LSLTLEQLIEICKETKRDRLKNVTKEQIADVLAKCDPREDTEFMSMKELVATMIVEIKEMRKTNEKVVTALDKMNRMEKEMDALKKSNDEMREQLKQHAEVIRHQQTFLEKVDQKEREDAT
jgi:cobalamin biosynthesis protein CbiD